MLGGLIRALGRAANNLFAEAGAMSRLALDSSRRLVLNPFGRGKVRSRETLEQLARAGNGSLPLVSLICLLVGMIMALQSAYQLRRFEAVDLVASLVAVSMSRELAPLLTAIIVAGRFGSAIAAELGTMRVSSEIDALEAMGIDPTSYLVVPRLVGLSVAMPCLTVFADAVGILGGMLVGVGALGLGSGRYLEDTVDALVLEDVLTGLVKSLAFACIIGLVGCREGLATRGGAEQVGRATTRAVVRSIVLVICADLIVTAWFYVRG
ncbi:MAG TPA: ABC transporter permease [Candidatus Polarisedimenticolaceae bacterium]|nr:ABC transporter permease [Candidatus Polarisedimenticolaceae bacterium]